MKRQDFLRLQYDPRGIASDLAYWCVADDETDLHEKAWVAYRTRWMLRWKKMHHPLSLMA